MIDEDDISEDEDDDHDDVIYLVTSLLSSTGLCYQCITAYCFLLFDFN